MDAADFSPQAPGTLVKIANGSAFVPDAPPESLTVSVALLNAVDAARGALGEFIGQAAQVPNELLITEPLLTIEAVESNRIEGTHTLVSDVLRQEVAGPSSDADEAGRNLEVILYRRALRMGASWLAAERPLNEFLIQALHNALLEDGRGRHVTRGRYRQIQVLIGSANDDPTTARFVPPPPEQVPPLMTTLSQYLSAAPQLPALIACGLAHYQFEAIHPFEDGNGRIGRLLVPLYLTAQRVIPRPILYLSAFLERRRDEYYDRLKRVSTHGAWDDWLVFFLEAVRSQADDSKQRVIKILGVRDQWRNEVRAASRSQAALAAVDLVMSRMWVTIPAVSAYAQCSYPAAKTGVDTLESLGILRRDPRLYPATWYAPDLIREIYG